jgi:hypothetical protein
VYKSGVLSALNPRKTHDLSVFLSKKTIYATFIFFLHLHLSLPVCAYVYFSVFRCLSFADRFSYKIQAISLDITPSEWDYVPLLESPDNMCVSITSISSLYDKISGADMCVHTCLKKLQRERDTSIFNMQIYERRPAAFANKFTAHCNDPWGDLSIVYSMNE